MVRNLFAYPFGRPQHMSEPNRALVRKAGYSCCCSAYGGINYGFSLPALQAYMAGWNSRHANAT